MADGLQRGHRLVDFEPGRQAGLDQAQHHGGGAEFEVVGGLAEVGVADDHVQPPVLVRRRVGFVAGVDDGAADGGLQADFGLEKVRPLADLVAGPGAVLFHADPAGPADNLPGDEERCQPADDVPERDVAGHQVVLVGAVGDGLVVGVVLVQIDRGQFRIGRQPAHRRQGHEVAGGVPGDGVERVGHFRAGVLGVGMVDVQPGAVAEDHVHQERAGFVLAVGLKFLPAVGEGDSLGVEDGRLVGQLVGVGLAALQRPARGRRAAVPRRCSPSGFRLLRRRAAGSPGRRPGSPGRTSSWRWPRVRRVHECRTPSRSP